MKSIFWLSVSFLCLVFISSCSDSHENEIEAELQVHFDDFMEEATIQGVDIDLDNFDIGAYVEDINERGTLGQCKSYSNGSKQVVIDEQFWNRSSELEREYVVFHELGHCLLGREHDDTKDGDGNCISIMQSGGGECEGAYDLDNRDDLLKELFE